MIYLILSILITVSPDIDKLFESAAKWRVGEAIQEVDSARKELVKLRERALDYIFKEKIKTRSTLEYRAIRYVVRHLRSISLPYIYQGLYDDNDTVRINCIRLLGDLKDTSSVDTLISFLHKEKNEKVVRSIIYSLGEIGLKRAASEIEPFTHSQDMRMRLVSVIALKKLKSPKSINCLFEAMEDEFFIIRETALQALSEIGTEEVLKRAIIKLRKNVPEEHVGDAVEAAGTGIQIITKPGILGIGAIDFAGKILSGKIQRAFDYKKCKDRIKYIRLVGKVASKICEEDPDNELFIQARHLLILYLNSPCWLARGYAVRALKRFNDPDMENLLRIYRLKETNLFVRSQLSPSP